MAVADILAGHTVGFVDTGCVVNGERQPSQVGVTDARGAFEITTGHPDVCQEADVLVMHTGVPDLWVVKNQAPMVWVVHGRPLASFRPEQAGQLVSYSLYADVAKWPRTKAMVHFWPEFQPFWNVLFPKEKHVCLDFPPIDGERFSHLGPVHEIAWMHRGKYNGLICDSWREDVDIFEIANGAIEAAKAVPGLKWHFYAMETGQDGRLRPCWEVLIDALRRMDALGEVCGRMDNMDHVYRSMDFVLTPHRIVTRVIGEALSCGTPVIAAEGCRATPYTADPSCPLSVAHTVENFIEELKESPEVPGTDALQFAATNFSLIPFGQRMTQLYESITTGELSAK